jgi:ABC-2 type transport system permease protein
VNPFLYDVLRVLRNKGVILSIALTTALAFTGLIIYPAFHPPTDPVTLHADEQIVVLLVGVIFSFFVPVLGIQSGYSTYARDRATGVLESILVRPVSRTSVMVSRYVAVVVACALGIGVGLTLVDALNLTNFGVWLPAQDMLGLFVGLLVEAVAFAGILFLLAHILRSPGEVMGASVAAFILIDVIWFFLLTFVGVLLSAASSLSGAQGIVRLEYADPAGYPLLTLAYAQGGLFGGFFSYSLPKIGITPFGLIVGGIFWACVPFLLALFLARTRD